VSRLVCVSLCVSMCVTVCVEAVAGAGGCAIMEWQRCRGSLSWYVSGALETCLCGAFRQKKSVIQERLHLVATPHETAGNVQRKVRLKLGPSQALILPGREGN